MQLKLKTRRTYLKEDQAKLKIEYVNWKKKTIQHAYIDKDMAKNHRECCKFSIHKPV